MEKELKTSGKMTYSFIWRFILYYVAILIILAVILYFMLGKVNMLVLSIFSIITMGILIFIPTKLATADILKTKKMDEENTRKFKRNIIIFYIIVMLFATFFNALSYGVTIVGLERREAEAKEKLQASESLTDEQKNKQIEAQNTYVEKVKKIERETFIIITVIDMILFVFGVIVQFKYTKKYQMEE